MSYGVFRRGFSHPGLALFVGLASVACIALFSGTTARAAFVTLDFTGAQGNNSGGIYTYPYNFTIDSSLTTYQLMCDDFDHMITAGDTWTAFVTTVADLNPTNVAHLQYGSLGVTAYLEAADLFTEEVNAYNSGNSDPEGLYNWAVWDLMTQSNVSGSSSLSSGDQATVQGYLNAAEAMGSSLTPSDFPNVIIYTPTDMTSGGPQEFFGYGTPSVSVPEPGTFAILGLAGAGLLRRRNRIAAH